MTVFTPLTDKDYEGLRRTLRSLQVHSRFLGAAKHHLLTLSSDVAMNQNVGTAVIYAILGVKPTMKKKQKVLWYFF